MKKSETILAPVLNGFSQVILQENKWSGLLIIAGIALGNWVLAVAGLIAAICANITARALVLPIKNNASGLYSFNAILVGMVMLILFKNTWETWCFVAIGSIATVLMQHFFMKFNIPGYTFPFISITWMIVALGNPVLESGGISIRHYVFENQYFINASLNNFSEIFFQSNVLSGVFFILALVIGDVKAGIFAVITSGLVVGIAWIMKQSEHEIELGIYGFNAILTLIALIQSKNKTLLKISAGVILTVFVNIICIETNVLDALGGALTFPFVLSTWIISAIK